LTNPPDRDPLPLPRFDAPDVHETPDEAARAFAVDPRENVVLEASAGTGKTSVLVRRYLTLLAAGVQPRNILAMTFTRKAAAEMRDRLVSELRRLAGQSAAGLRQWQELRDQLGDIAISTIDAFCLALLGEFPLEAGLDPGFAIADDHEVAASVEAAVIQALAIARARAGSDESLRWLLAQVPAPALTRALAELVERREVAGAVLAAEASRASTSLTFSEAIRLATGRVADALRGVPGGLLSLTEDRPDTAAFDLVRADIETVVRGLDDPVQQRAALDGLRHHFLKTDGQPRVQLRFPKSSFASAGAWSRHVRAFRHAAPLVGDALARLDRDTGVLLVRGLARLHGLAVGIYRRSLTDREVVDFAEALTRTEALLANRDEFSQSRYRLEARYHHVLVDEFQDTSRQQWKLVSHLVESWREGQGIGDAAPLPPSIFIVGDHKQSIYGFRDADVTILREAGAFVAGLRPRGNPRRTISRSYRARPELLAFVNDLSAGMAHTSTRADAFRYEAGDHFPLDSAAKAAQRESAGEPALGLAVAESDVAASQAVADEIARLLTTGATIRDRDTGLARPVRPGDVAVIFRARESHRVVESALEAHGIPTYVFKGLGFFAADEVQDTAALVHFLARPASPLRVAAFLRSRLVRLSDSALLWMAGGDGNGLPGAILGRDAGPAWWAGLGSEDQRVLRLLRESAARWLSRVDRTPPADLIDDVLSETDYLWELRGVRAPQARENVKKVRMLVRRLQNRGSLTMLRLAEHLDRLSAGDDANAIIDAVDAVNLMTIHAAKGLEFPVVFLVGLGRGTGEQAAIRVVSDAGRQGGRVEIPGALPRADAGRREADLEETKRLMYVAATRARDRFYFAATTTRGRFRKGRGSLGEVLPGAFVGAIERAAASPPDVTEVTWASPGGRSHRFALCRPRPSGPPRPATAFVPLTPAAGEPPELRRPLRSQPGLRVMDARAWAMQQCGMDETDFARIADVGQTTPEAIRGRADVAVLCAQGQALYEVPFTLRDATVLLRGTIDCVIVTPNRVTVLEFETGQPAPWHQAQLDICVRAATHLWPGTQVEGRLVYSECQ
jgi:ATP-dependent helicase/nuclease subunit A